MPQKNRVRFAQSSQKLYLKLSKEDEYRQLVGRWLDQKHLEEALMVSYLSRALGLDAHDALEKAREKEASDISKIEEARRMRARHYYARMKASSASHAAAENLTADADAAAHATAAAAPEAAAAAVRVPDVPDAVADTRKGLPQGRSHFVSSLNMTIALFGLATIIAVLGVTYVTVDTSTTASGSLGSSFGWSSSSVGLGVAKETRAHGDGAAIPPPGMWSLGVEGTYATYATADAGTAASGASSSFGWSSSGVGLGVSTSSCGGEGTYTEADKGAAASDGAGSFAWHGGGGVGLGATEETRACGGVEVRTLGVWPSGIEGTYATTDKGAPHSQFRLPS